MKEYSVSAFFPEAKSYAAETPAVVVRAGNLALAAKRGIEVLHRNKGVLGKRIKHARITIAYIRDVPCTFHIMEIVAPGDYREREACVYAKEAAAVLKGYRARDPQGRYKIERREVRP